MAIVIPVHPSCPATPALALAQPEGSKGQWRCLEGAKLQTDPRGRCGKPKDNISLIVRNSIKPYKTIIITLNHDILFAGLLVCWRFFFH